MDNGSLAARVGAGIEVAEAIPLNTPQSIVAGGTATYEAFILDDEADAPDEDGLSWNDINETLIVRAIGYARDGTTDETTKVVLEALIGPVPIPAIVSDGDLTISGNVDIDGTNGGVHSNSDLTIAGGAASVATTITASGTYTGSLAGSGGAAPLPVQPVLASDYLTDADFILTSSGTMTDQAGAVLCTWSGSTPCNNWDFNSGSGEWSFSGTPPDGTYYVEGAVRISGNHGSNGDPLQITIIAEGSIDISGNQDFTPDTPDLLFVTDGDLDSSGNFDMHDQGQLLVHEQISLSGNPEIIGQIIVENTATASSLVTANAISGNVTITYNGGLGTGVYTVAGWRDVR